MFSKACEYAIRASIMIAHQSQKGVRISLKAIAEKIDSPEAFTAKILQELVKNNIVNSLKGPQGGFNMDDNQLAHITVSDIVTTIDGDKIFNGCGLGLTECNEKKPCPVHHQFKTIRNDLKNLLEKTSIRELSDDINSGLAFLRQ